MGYDDDETAGFSIPYLAIEIGICSTAGSNHRPGGSLLTATSSFVAC
jgi:hypothetical protein